MLAAAALRAAARRATTSARSAAARRLSDAPQKVDRAARKAARKQAGGGAAPTGDSVQTGTTKALWASVGLGTAGVSLGIYSLMADPDESAIARAAQNSAPGKFLVANVSAAAEPFVKPSREKLLPDWPPDYLNIGPDVPCPHTLVLDLDDTLVTATWDRRHGWRHAKRPGVEQFLRDMAKYYEVVIFSSNIAGVVDPVVNALDREGCAMHRLYRDATVFRRGAHKKDLSVLNRNPRKIVVVDKDAKACLQAGSTITVKPFTDAADKADTALEDITPFLAALVNEGVQDVPQALAKFSARDAVTVAREYEAMVQEARTRTDSVRNVGLGGFVRSAAAASREAPAMPAARASSLAAKGLSAAAIAGEAPEEKPKRGRLFAYWEKKAKDAEEDQKAKQEAWQKVMQKREQQRRLRAERA